MIKELQTGYILLIVGALAGLVYLNSLDNAFVSDDILTIVENPQIGNLTFALKHLNGVDLLKGLVYLVAGESVYAYHAVNIFFHILASTLVFYFLQLLTSKRYLALIAALIFALHPVHTEAVTWISGGAYPQFSAFFLLSFILFHHYLEKRKPFYLAGTIVSYFLALLFSVWAVPLLPLFFLYEKYLREEEGVNWGLYLILGLMAAFFVLFFYLQGVAGQKAATGASVGGTHNLTITAPHSLWQYTRVLVWPWHLAFFRENDFLSQLYVLLTRIWAAVLVFILPAVLFWRRKKLAFFLWALFLLSVSLSLSPIKIGWYVAERYLYLGVLSFAVLAAYLLVRLEEKMGVKNLAIFLLIPLLLFYSARIFLRNRDWQNLETLWAATVKDSPRSPRAHNNLGNVYATKGDWRRAAEQFSKALELKPNHDSAAYNLGVAHFKLGDLERAQKALSLAVKINPQHDSAYYNLGVISLKKGDLTNARNYWLKALSINPQYVNAARALKALEAETED